MRRPADRTRKLIMSAVLTALALALSLIDTSLSAVLAFIPGFRLGLANVVSLFALYYMGLPWALLISLARCLLAAVFAGQVTMFLFSVMGAAGSLLVMYVLKRWLSIVKVSTAGGITHNMMQLAAASIVTATPSLIYYLPILVCLGTLTGFGLGIVCSLVFARLPQQVMRHAAQRPKGRAHARGEASRAEQENYRQG